MATYSKQLPSLCKYCHSKNKFTTLKHKHRTKSGSFLRWKRRELTDYGFVLLTLKSRFNYPSWRAERSKMCTPRTSRERSLNWKVDVYSTKVIARPSSRTQTSNASYSLKHAWNASFENPLFVTRSNAARYATTFEPLCSAHWRIIL